MGEQDRRGSAGVYETPRNKTPAIAVAAGLAAVALAGLALVIWLL